MSKGAICAFGLVAICALAHHSRAVTINVGTAGNAATWSITGAGATGSPAFQTSANNPGEISITSNGFNSGSFVAGGSLANFNGFWLADKTFTLPAGATSIVLAFSNFYGNDRAVLQLNGTTIANMDHLNNTGNGVFAFPPGPPDVPFTITGVTSGNITTGFNAGGTNTLRIIVNNTGTTSISSPTATFATSGDATDANLTATVTYLVPEPASIGFISAAAAGLLTRRRQPSRRRGLAMLRAT